VLPLLEKRVLVRRGEIMDGKYRGLLQVRRNLTPESLNAPYQFLSLIENIAHVIDSYIKIVSFFDPPQPIRISESFRGEGGRRTFLKDNRFRSSLSFQARYDFREPIKALSDRHAPLLLAGNVVVLLLLF